MRKALEMISFVSAAVLIVSFLFLVLLGKVFISIIPLAFTVGAISFVALIVCALVLDLLSEEC